MKLSIIIVSYNVRSYLEQCLQSVQKALEGIEGEVWVVDNNSQDDSVEVLRRDYPWVRLIANTENMGFARANNLAIRQSQSDYVLLLNPDTVVEEPTLRGVLDFMDAHPEAGGAGVMMHNEDGTLAPESRRGLPTPWVAGLKMLGFTKRYYMSHLPWDQPGRIDVISGAFCFLRRKAIDQVGRLAELVLALRDHSLQGQVHTEDRLPLRPHLLSGHAHLLPKALQPPELPLCHTREDGHLFPCVHRPHRHPP